MTDKELFQNKKKASLSVKKSIGVLDKVMQLIDEDTYCPEIIQQIDAAKGLLDSAKKTLLIGHLDHCIVNKLKNNTPKATKELLKIFDLK